MRVTFIVVAVLGLLASGCGGDSVEPTINESADMGSYELTIESASHGNTELSGRTVDTNWNAESGEIYLGTDMESAGPIGTLTMAIASPITDSEGALFAVVLDAVASKTDCRVCTADLANGKAYRLLPVIGDSAFGALRNVEIGSNFITGICDLNMEKVLTNPNDEPEIVKVVGSFVAVSN